MNKTTDWTQWCPYQSLASPPPNVPVNHLVSVDDTGNIALDQRSSGPNEAMPTSPPNGGLYGGPQSTKPWANIAVTPTVANLIHNNLRSANPPPGATEQYPGTQRMGNNYQTMPGISWYRPGLYYLQTT